MNDRTPLGAGFAAALRHRRLAVCLWLALAFSAALAWLPIRTAVASFDEGPFRESILKGWDSLGMLAWIALRFREIDMLQVALVTAAVVSFLLHLALNGGLLRVLLADVPRPVLRRLVSESASLLRPNLWAFLRFGVTLAIWEAIVVGIPVSILEKLAGDDAVPNNGWSIASTRYAIVAGIVVYLVVRLRFDLARIALAKDDAVTARGAYRVAKERISEGRASAILLMLIWIVAGLLLQAGFTSAGLSLNPMTGGAVGSLFLFRQLGFVLFAMTQVGYWASLLAWEKARRPVPMPLPEWRPAPYVPPAPIETAPAPVEPPSAVVEPAPSGETA